MAAVDFQLPALQTPQTQTPEQNAQALALIENSRSLAEQRQAQAEQRQQQAAAIAQQAGMRSAWQAAMQASQCDPDQAALALDKVNPDAAAYGREQTNTARAKALDVATKTADLHTKIVGQTADLLNSINTQDPNDYAAKVLAVRGMAGNDKNMQQFLQTTLPMPGEQGFDPSQIPQYVQRAQNAAIPYKDYWDKMQASVTAANNGDAVKSLAYALDAEKNGSPQDLLKTIASHRALGMKSDVAQPFVDAITSGAYKADPLFFAKLGGITNPEQAANMTGTIPGTTTPTEAAKKDAAEQAMAGANLAIRRGELQVAQDREAREAGAGAAIGSGKPQDPNAPHGDAYLATLPTNEAQTVKALAEGRIPWPTGTALRQGPWSARVDEALQYDPTLDTATISNNARQKVRNDFTSGTSAKTINAMNTVVGHLADLQKIGEGLGNTSYDWVNEIKNWLTPGGSKTGVSINNFNTAKQAVADELTRVYRQAGGSEQDIQSWQATLNAAKSPQELEGAFKTIGGLLESKLGAMQNQYQQGMGTTPVNVVTPQTRATLDRLQGSAAPKMVRMKKPNGDLIDVPQEKVDAAKKLGATVVGG